jgi:hypothetical protein
MRFLSEYDDLLVFDLAFDHARRTHPRSVCTDYDDGLHVSETSSMWILQVYKIIRHKNDPASRKAL